MHKKLAINKHFGACPYSCKTVATLSLLAALQISSCAVNRRQGLIDSSNLFANAIDLSPEFEQTDAFKKFQQRTADIVSANSDSKNAKTVFFEAVKKGDVKEVQYLLGHLAITPKAVVEGIQFSLKYKDTFSFRYTRKRMVDYLLRQDNLSQDDLSAQDEAGDALFHLIVKRGDIDAAKFLAWKLSVDHLCMQNSENQTPMHLAAACKSKKILEALLYNISKTHPDRVIEELFKKDKNGYSVIERSYLSKVGAFNYLQLPTFSRQGSEMFKFILKVLPVRLSSDQLAIIACSIERAAERKLIDQGYAATLRAILKRYIEKKYGNSADEIVRYVARKKNRPAQVHDEGYASGSELP